MRVMNLSKPLRSVIIILLALPLVVTGLQHVTVSGDTSPLMPRSSSVTTALFTSTDAPIPFGQPLPDGTSVYDTASVTGSSTQTPTGTVTYNFFNGTLADCSGSPRTSQTVNMLADGSVPRSAMTGPLEPTTIDYYYSFQARYSGDNHYSPSISPCESFAISVGAVGGLIVPVDKLGLLMPYVALGSAILSVLGFAISSRSHKRKNDDQ